MFSYLSSAEVFKARPQHPEQSEGERLLNLLYTWKLWCENSSRTLTSQAYRRSSGRSVNFAMNGPNLVPCLILAFATTESVRMSRFCVWSCRKRDISSNNVSREIYGVEEKIMFELVERILA